MYLVYRVDGKIKIYNKNLISVSFDYWGMYIFGEREEGRFGKLDEENLEKFGKDLEKCFMIYVWRVLR